MDGIVEHVSVLYKEALAGLRIRAGGRYVDATTGMGGHAAGILRASAPDGLLLGLDADPEAVRRAERELRPFGDRATVRVANFRHIAECSRECGFGQVDGILMDLGLSSSQLADASRGFSFSRVGPLDMRLDPRHGQPASNLVNRLPEAELADLLWHYGEERHSRRIARAIVNSRPVETTTELADLIVRAVGRREKIHPATRTFQALRIAVNDELLSLSEALPQARDLLCPGGRLVVISFHSLEDGIVKRFLQLEASNCVCPPDLPICRCEHTATMHLPNRRAIRPGDDEIAANPRSRSARLRTGEKL
jgi:16S rRNA (cytosine1402-N4)-methyltransferase